MKINFDKANYNENNKSYLNVISRTLLKPYLSEGLEKGSDNKKYPFEYESDISKSDIYLLPFYWYYYVDNERIREARSQVENAKYYGKPVVIFNIGDYPANVPFKDVILFERAGYLSTPELLYHSALPCFLDDYLEIYKKGTFEPREKADIPTIGFCGLASTSAFITIYRKLRLNFQQINYKLGKRTWEPPPFETSSFRTKVLEKFTNVDGLRTNYILRKKYRGGVVKDKSYHNPVKETFVNNILESDYTVCMRGGGNFSQRFYETLCLGRIPIFVDTDCLLPFQDEIEYKSIFPWIDVKDLPNIADIVKDFHANLSSDNFVNLQKTCRQLWLEHLTLEGFNADFVKNISSLILHT